jgi:cytochrome c553
MRSVIVTVVGIAVFGVGVAAQGDAAKGRTIYVDRKCGTCHKTDKADEKGGKLSTVLSDTVGKLSPEEIRSWLTDTSKMEAKLPKKPPMPMSAFLKTLKPPLSDADVTNLIAYLRTLPTAKPGLPPTTP